MPAFPRHREAEARFRSLITEAELAQPDAVEYREASLVFLWHGPKVAIVVDLDEGGEPVAVSKR
jgi:hypothetical protein